MFAGGFWSEVLHLLPLTLRDPQHRAEPGWGVSLCVPRQMCTWPVPTCGWRWGWPWNSGEKENRSGSQKRWSRFPSG